MITDYFASLTQVLQLDYAAVQKAPHHGEMLKLLYTRLLDPLLPASVRHGPPCSRKPKTKGHTRVKTASKILD